MKIRNHKILPENSKSDKMTYENKPYDNKPSDAYPSAPPPSYNATYDESAYLERIHYYLMPFNSKKVVGLRI